MFPRISPKATKCENRRVDAEANIYAAFVVLHKPLCTTSCQGNKRDIEQKKIRLKFVRR
jgi:glutamine synthetase